MKLNFKFKANHLLLIRLRSTLWFGGYMSVCFISQAQYGKLIFHIFVLIFFYFKFSFFQFYTNEKKGSLWI